MAANTVTASYEKLFSSEPSVIYSYLTDPSQIANWSHEKCDGVAKAGEVMRVYDGGAMYKFVELVENSKIVAQFQSKGYEDKSYWSDFTIELLPFEGGTKLVFTETKTEGHHPTSLDDWDKFFWSKMLDYESLPVAKRPRHSVYGVSHFQIPVTDMERATKFYKDVFKWVIGTGSYTSVKYESETKECIEGGLVLSTAVIKSEEVTAPVPFVEVASVDAHLELIVAAGGSVQAPKSIMEGAGAVAYFYDTEGNILGLWEGFDRKEPLTVTGVCHLEIPTTDMGKSKDFFKENFGWTFMEFNGYEMFSSKEAETGTTVGGGFMPAKEVRVTGDASQLTGPLLFVHVPDITAALEKVTKHGGKVVTPSTELDGNMGFTGHFTDSEGQLFAFYQNPHGK